MLKKTCNMGTADRIARFVVGVFLVYIGFINSGLIGDSLLNVAVGAFGVANVISAMLGICPAYLLVNISTLGARASSGIAQEEQICPVAATQPAVADSEPLRRKLLLSVVMPMLFLLGVFGWTVFNHNVQLEFTELSKTQDAAAQLVEQFIESSDEERPNASQQLASAAGRVLLGNLLADTGVFMLHDAQLNRIPMIFEKGTDHQYVVDALRDEIGPFNDLGNGYKRGMMAVGDDRFLWSTTQLANKTQWITAVWQKPELHSVYSQLFSTRFMVIVLTLAWMAIWSAFYIVRKFADNVEDNSRQLYLKSLHDSLTGLPNRLKIEAVISAHAQQFKRDKECLVLMMVDLIEFRDINDTLGHVIGDELLTRVASLLQELENDKTTVLRMAGDVFCLVSVTSQNRMDTCLLVNTVHDKLEQTHELNGIPIAVQARVGLSSYPVDSTNPQDLVRLSDIALAQAKRQRVKDCFYQYEQDTHSVRKLSLLSRLRTAIEQDKLTLAYQPKVNILDNSLAGVEVLVRWTDEEYGPVSPVEFVTWAEKSGLIDKLTRWVVVTAEKQCQLWRDQGFSIHFAINLSPTNLHDEKLLPLISDLVKNGCFGNGMLELELTENAVMEDPDKALETMNVLSKLDVSFAIDDFGTGLSSFTYLRKFPVTNLKIDRAFVMDVDESDRDAILLHSMVKLGHSLGCVVTAEGVEDQSSLERLRSFNCDHVQGYHVCKPLPADQLMNWLSNSDWTTERKAA